MAIKVKPVTASADKLVRNAQAASQEWGQNAAASAETWAANAAAAQANYQQGITGGNIAARFAAGVRKAGAEKFRRKVASVGVQRFGPGVEAGKQDYVANAEQYFSLLAGLTLPARSPRGSAANTQRVTAVTQALNAKRLALLGMTAGA